MPHACTYLLASVSSWKHLADGAHGRSEAGKLLAHHSASLMRFSSQLDIGVVKVDSMPPQANYSSSTGYSA